jgi:hypothetical protein
MSQLRPNRFAACGLASSAKPQAAKGGYRWIYLLAVLLLAGLLFAHIGCHGDEDNELFTPAARLFQ